MSERLFVWLQALLPTRALSSLIHRIAHVRTPWFKNTLIRRFVRLYAIDLGEAELGRAEDYPHFNAFFTRALRPGARPLPEDGSLVISPVDGRISQVGRLDGHRLIQAKGHGYRADELLGEDAAAYAGGDFCTIYLAPHNYHRIHMPMDARLTGWRHLPGRLFSVNPATVRRRQRLFSRNERVCAYFETDAGPLAVVFVGALFVGSVDLAWAGRVSPPHSRRASPRQPAAGEWRRGDEIGRFNMGSTVILVAAPGVLEWQADRQPGQALRMGEPLARARGPNLRPPPQL